MFLFIFLIILGIGGLGCLIGGIAAGSADSNSRIASGVIGVLLMLASAFSIVFGLMMVTVGTQDIAIVLNGGAATGDLGPGRHFIPPWSDTATMDNSVQVEDYNVADPTSGKCDILIRIANQQTACARVELRVQLQQDQTDVLFRQYKSTAGVVSGLVTPAVQKYANEVFQGFDPISDVNSTAAIGSSGRPSTQQFADALQKDLQRVIGKDVIIDNLTIPTIEYDGSVQAQLNAAFTQKAKTVIAQQAEQTAAAQAQANRELTAKNAVTPLVLVQQCLTYLNTLADKDLTPPAGFSCWPGSGSGIVIPAASGSGK